MRFRLPIHAYSKPAVPKIFIGIKTYLFIADGTSKFSAHFHQPLPMLWQLLKNHITKPG